ncbi:MAG TPA: glycosyltransferase [Butyricimonas virosa]|uniref:Glycosyltransferase n=1 Tax=Butyricimonas virosa TaxID=544645 RepID=A0A921H0T9_9BACT|nr:glycosyltransferase [Butyricimonas virosa]
MKNTPLVSIDCITYNQAPYIRQCLEGFLMQKTTFLFEILIHDDASTDGTSDIIREYETKYPDLIKPIYQKENQYSKGIGISATFQFPRAKGKYIAICEGDDYWIDPLKLQKQVDFLEKNSSYGMIFSRAVIYNQNKKMNTGILGKPNVSFYELLIRNSIPTLTVVLKRELVLEYLDKIVPISKKLAMGDYPMWLWVALKSDIAFLPDVTAVYNYLLESASHSVDGSKRVLFRFSSFEIAYYFASRYLEKEAFVKFVNIRFVSLFLSIVKHRSFCSLNLLVSVFQNQRMLLSMGNKILYFFISKIC